VYVSAPIGKRWRKETDSMDRESPGANSLVQAEAKKIHIKAEEFLWAFRNRPDDYYLMERFSLKPKHLRKVYDQLIERGLLEEYEYNCREKKSVEVEETRVAPATPSPVVSTPDHTSEALGEFTTFPSDFHSQPAPVPHIYRDTSTAVELQTTELCPKCHRAKQPAHPNSCPHCGVVFAKIKQSETSDNVAIWVDDTGRFP